MPVHPDEISSQIIRRRGRRAKYDYAVIEKEWRDGILSLKKLAELMEERTGKYVNFNSINSFFKSRNIPRRVDSKEDANHAKTQKMADAVHARAVANEAASTSKKIEKAYKTAFGDKPIDDIDDEAILRANAASIAAVKLAHQTAAAKTRQIVIHLADVLGEQVVGPNAREKLGENLRLTKMLAETLQITVDLERQVMGIVDEQTLQASMPPSVQVTFVQPEPRADDE